MGRQVMVVKRFRSWSKRSGGFSPVVGEKFPHRVGRITELGIPNEMEVWLCDCIGRLIRIEMKN